MEQRAKTFSKQDPGALLRMAAECKRRGDLSQAIEILRRAYEAIEKGSSVYPLRTFLRLPQYLQEADEREAAWDELFKLLEEGYPHQDKQPETLSTDRTEIFEAITEFLYRDGCAIEATLYALLSMHSRVIELRRKNRKRELATYCAEVHLASEIERLTARAGLPDLNWPLLQVLRRHFDDENPGGLAGDVKQLLQIS